MNATSLLNAVLKSYRGGVGYLRDRELGRRRTVENLEELSASLTPKDFVETMLPHINGDLAALKLDTLESYIDSIAELFNELGDKDRKMCVERIIVPVIANDTSTRQNMEKDHSILHEKALDLLDQVNSEMLNPHVGVLVAMLENKYEDEHDDVVLKKVLSLLQKVEPEHLKNQVGGLLKAMGLDVMFEWRREVADLLEEIPNVDWDLYVEEICEMLEGESEELEWYTYFVNYLSPEIRPRVVWENDDYMIERRHTVGRSKEDTTLSERVEVNPPVFDQYGTNLTAEEELEGGENEKGEIEEIADGENEDSDTEIEGDGEDTEIEGDGEDTEIDNMMDYFDDPTGDAAFDGENLANDSMDMEGVWELLS